MKYLSGILISLFIVSSYSFSSGIKADKNHPVNWLTWEEAMEAFDQNPKPIMIDVWTTWCGWCKKMDDATFKNEVIAEKLNERFYAVKMNGEMKRNVDFRGKTYKFVASGRRGYHELPAGLMNGKMSYPTIVFLSDKLELIQPLPGYRGPQDLHPILRFFGEGIYRTKGWDQFQADYESPFTGDEPTASSVIKKQPTVKKVAKPKKYVDRHGHWVKAGTSTNK